MTPLHRSMLLNCANRARTEADHYQPHFPRHGLELRRIAEGIEAVLRDTESDDAATARRNSIRLIAS
jgi:hypothetical protein